MRMVIILLGIGSNATGTIPTEWDLHIILEMLPALT